MNTASTRPGRGQPNILLFVSDEERHWELTETLIPEALRGAFQAKLRARGWFRQHGVSFSNYHTPTAPCSPARSIMFTGHHAPDTQVVTNMDIPAQESLGGFSRNPNPGSNGRLGRAFGPPALGYLLQDCGYYPAYQGKVHLAKDDVLETEGQMSQRLGFLDWHGTFGVPGHPRDVEGPRTGATLDPRISGLASAWLVNTASTLDTPWCLAVNFINPHDIMLVDLDGPGGTQRIQPRKFPLLPSPRRPPYDNWWAPVRPPNFREGAAVIEEGAGPRPAAIDEWASICSAMWGDIPFEATCTVEGAGQVPMWQAYINYYLNCIIDSDDQMWHVLQTLLSTPKLEAQRDNTLLIYMADHGEMAMSHQGLSRYYGDELPGGDPSNRMMPLRQKGPLIYRENNRLPFVIASPSSQLVPHPAPDEDLTVNVLASHIDLVPTILDFVRPAGDWDEWYRETYGAYLRKLENPTLDHLVGRSLRDVLLNPSTYPAPAWTDSRGRRRTALLLTYDAPDTVDADFADKTELYSLSDLLPSAKTGSGPTAALEHAAEPKHWDGRKRGMIRGLYDGRYKFARFFAPVDYARQVEVNGDYAWLTAARGPYCGQDIQLFDCERDQAECMNLAERIDALTHQPSIAQLNTELLLLMKAELASFGTTPNSVQFMLDNYY